ncbi:hypothetical protein [Aliidiomarina quisquiliarum]|uniref:hypothetical protein n=1 Tax=Aliidiomarina quisquiliarum TaxID=2938947 RepID=UPI00208E1123|nr:hypothetical protein [Aliidiomarina quisquiliarum]
MSTIVGGTVSKLVGGKFANGAVSAGLASLFTVSKQEHARRRAMKDIYEDKDADNSKRTNVVLRDSAHRDKALSLDISNELSTLVDALVADASTLAKAILGEFDVGVYSIKVDANYRLNDSGVVYQNGKMELNPNGYYGHSGVAQLVLGHELIHYRDWKSAGPAWSQMGNATEVRAYQWEINYANKFISDPEYLESYKADATENCNAYGGCG